MFHSVLLLVALSAATQPVLRGASKLESIVALAESIPTLSILVTALKAGNLTDALSGPEDFTVFAPSNAAFAKLGTATLAHLLDPSNINELQAILELHVVGNRVLLSFALTDGERLETLNDLELRVAVAHGQISLGDPGSNNATVTGADNRATNGVVHVVDTVMLPRSPPPAGMNIVQLAQSVSALSTLVTAIEMESRNEGSSGPNLTSVLSSPGPYTVFAPNNAAFDALPAGTLQRLLKPVSANYLAEILEVHVVAGSIHAKDLKNGETVTTVAGTTLTVKKGLLGKITLSSPGTKAARVVAADNAANNGVVHIVDAVLLPDAPDTNHLWFRGFTAQPTLNDVNAYAYRCGEVDAGPRMPAKLFKPENAQQLAAYEEVTIRLYSGDRTDGLLMGKLERGRCSAKGYTAVWPGKASESVDWAPPYLMDALCASKCGCNYRNSDPSSSLPTCVDRPDKPDEGEWCSLCGPEFNAPIEIDFFACALTSSCSGPGEGAR